MFRRDKKIKPIIESPNVPIDPQVFDEFIITIGDEKINVLTNSNHAALREAIEQRFVKEFATENWLFLKEVQELNKKSRISHDDIVSLFHRYIPASSPQQINIQAQTKIELENKFAAYKVDKKAELKLKDFEKAVSEIISLTKADTLKRATSLSEVIAAHNEDQQVLIAIENEAKLKPQKIELQLNGLEVLDDLNKYTDIRLKDFDKKSIFGAIIKKKPTTNELFKSSQTIARVMKDELKELLIDSDNMSYSEFKKNYDDILAKNKLVLNNLYNEAVKLAKTFPESSTEHKVVTQQSKQLGDLISTMYLKFSIKPEEIAEMKDSDIASRVRGMSNSSTDKSNEDSVSFKR